MIHSLFIHIISFIYRRIAKPILFQISPDRVHNDMLRFCKFFGSYSLLRGVTRLTFKKGYKKLKQEYFGISFESPVGVAAGFDKNGDTPPVVSNLGFGFMEVGSVTAAKCPGNPKPWFQRLPKSKSLAVHVGLANNGSKNVIKHLEDQHLITSPFPVVLSVAKTNSKKTVSDEAAIQDYVTSVSRAAGKKSISMIEINISCPNTYGGEPFTDPTRLHKLLSAIDEVNTPQPIFIKMPNHLPWSSFSKLLEIISLHKVSGVTISNLAKDYSTIIDTPTRPIKGGLSGRPTWKTSNDLIKKTYSKYGDSLVIIGVGGIFTAEDAYTKIKLGASLVQLVTGMIFQGPQIAASINKDLDKLLSRDGFSNISEAIGINAR